MNNQSKLELSEAKHQFPSTKEKIEALENSIIKAIEISTSNGETDKIEVFTKLYMEVQKSKSLISINKRVEEEGLIRNQMERKIGVVKQIISIILSLCLIPLGIYIYLNKDQNTGIFILGAGFSSAGLASFINSEFVKGIFNKSKS